MIVHKINFPFYGIIVVLSVIIGMFYIYINMKKDIKKNSQILLYYIMYISFAFIFGKMYTFYAYWGIDEAKVGLSAYGGLIGVVVAAIIFEKILPCDGKIIKYSVLSLPLVYGISKIACAIVGCCGGIHYTGFFKMKYDDVLNIWQFPVQITETIVFLIIFLICNHYKDKKNISYVVLILVSIFKFSLDFLRYDHMKILITRNQMFSIILLLTTIIIYFINKYKIMKKII